MPRALRELRTPLTRSSAARSRAPASPRVSSHARVAQSGNPYYFNAATGTTSWTPPDGGSHGSATGAAGLPPGWEARFDPASGQ
jgi:hypothetical protein